MSKHVPNRLDIMDKTIDVLDRCQMAIENLTIDRALLIVGLRQAVEQIEALGEDAGDLRSFLENMSQ